MESVSRSAFARREYSPQEFVDVLWKGKWVILSVTLVLTVGAGVAAWILPKKYESITVIAPVSTSTGGGQLGALGSLASQVGGLAALTGFSAGDSKKSESIAVLQSEALTEKYIETTDLLPILYEDQWDPKKLRWRDDNPKKIPTLWKANRYFRKNIRTITTDTKTGLVTLTITWKNPVVAAKWANDLVKLTNDYLRSKAIAESERNIAYLNGEAAKTNVVEARQAIFSILQNEINKTMLARGSEEFAFKILDPAVPSDTPSSPQLLVWMLGGMFGGLFVSISAVLMHSSLRSTGNG